MGAGSNKSGKGSREQQKKREMEKGARKIIRQQEENFKRSREQTNDKGAVKTDKKERAPQNGREHGERGKMSKGAGSIDPPNRASPYCPPGMFCLTLMATFDLDLDREYLRILFAVLNAICLASD